MKWASTEELGSCPFKPATCPDLCYCGRRECPHYYRFLILRKGNTSDDRKSKSGGVAATAPSASLTDLSALTGRLHLIFNIEQMHNNRRTSSLKVAGGKGRHIARRTGAPVCDLSRWTEETL